MPSASEVANPKKDVNFKTAQMVRLISEIGPDIPEISRRLHQFKESVRYRYKEKILNAGFVVQAAIDQEKLGLRRLALIVDFADFYRPYANAILSAMSELCYVVYFARVSPEGYYVVNAAVPAEYVHSFWTFIDALRDRGLFSSVELLTFEWARNPPMRAEYYDFNVGRWDFDWSKSSKPDPSSAAYMPAKPEAFDYIDLLILKELQKDANKTLVNIARELGVSYKKLAWHHAVHVLGRGLVKSYRLNWMGTAYDYATEKALNRKHRYVELILTVRDVSATERMQLMAGASHLPFLWFEAGGSNYYADFAFPIDSTMEALGYLESILEPFRGRYRHYIVDTTNALTFTVSYHLYRQEQGKWTFNSEELLSRFDDLLMRIRAAG